MAKRKTTADEEMIIEKSEEVVEAPKKIQHEADELIPCRSVTQGELIFKSRKTDIMYIWSGFGDIKEMEYQDLVSLLSTRSRFLYDPLFVIEDEELLEEPRWKDIKKMYDEMYTYSDIHTLLNLPNNQFEAALRSVPTGLKNAVMNEVSTRLIEGSFDSLQKIKIIDAVCGSDLKCLL